MTMLNAKDHGSRDGGPSYSLGHRLFRSVWNVTWLVLAAWTPPPLHRWRRLVLMAFGATMHPTAKVYGSARVWYPPNLRMEARAVLGPRSTCYCVASVVLHEGAIVSPAKRVILSDRFGSARQQKVKRL